MNETVLVCVIIIVLLALIIIGVLIYATSVKSTLIEPSQCPTVSGSYSATPNKSGTTASICGTSQNQLCNFNEIVTLGDAMNICNATSGCNAFVYNSTNKVMSIIVADDAVFDDSNFDLYNRQVPTIIT